MTNVNVCGYTQISAGPGLWTVKKTPQTLQLTTSAVASSQKDEEKLICLISFLTAAEGTDPKASAGVPVGGSDNTKSSCFVQQQFEVGNKAVLYPVYVSAFCVCSQWCSQEFRNTEVMTPTCVMCNAVIPPVVLHQSLISTHSPKVCTSCSWS